MINLDNTVGAEEFLVFLEQQVQDLAIRIRIPSAIATVGLHLHASHIETALQHVHDIVFHVLTTGSWKDLDQCLAFTDVDDSEVRARLHHVGIRRNHAHHAVMTSIDGADEVVLNLHGHLHLRCLHILGIELNTGLNTLVFVDKVSFPVIYQLFQGLHVLLRQREHHLSLEWDGIAHVTTVPAGQSCLALLDSLSNEAHHQFIGIASTLMNLQSGVSTTESFECHLHGHILWVGLHLFVFQCSGEVDSTSRANHEFPPCLRVEVQQDVTLQLPFRKVVGTIHTRLLIGGDQCLHRTVFQGLVLHDSHDRGHTESVISTKGCSLCLHPLAIDPRLNGIGLKVMRTLGCLLRHHVHVSLQDHALSVLHSR